ncbi:hypothetical protein Bbelb_351970 [Branchiostoma belcheri]|nr:hypothetical protein Bbelb_351970 [Branchiostoma belcheri]
MAAKKAVNKASGKQVNNVPTPNPIHNTSQNAHEDPHPEAESCTYETIPDVIDEAYAKSGYVFDVPQYDIAEFEMRERAESYKKMAGAKSVLPGLDAQDRAYDGGDTIEPYAIYNESSDEDD